MTLKKKDQIRALLKSIETGDPEPVAVVNEAKYIQHNPETHEGSGGLAVLFARLAKSNPRVNIVRAFEDGDFVFAHTEYDFERRSVGFEIFRFEDGLAVEHWDNIQKRLSPNLAGHSMVDGPTKAVDHELTEKNRSFIHAFVEAVLVDGQLEKISHFVDDENFIEHNPQLTDGASTLRETLEVKNNDRKQVDYRRVHRVLAEGNFVLSVSEGLYRDVHTSFYDLFRIDKGKIVEHWDTTEPVLPLSEWKNDNGKF